MEARQGCGCTCARPNGATPWVTTHRSTTPHTPWQPGPPGDISLSGIAATRGTGQTNHNARSPSRRDPHTWITSAAKATPQQHTNNKNHQRRRNTRCRQQRTTRVAEPTLPTPRTGCHSRPISARRPAHTRRNPPAGHTHHTTRWLHPNNTTEPTTRTCGCTHTSRTASRSWRATHSPANAPQESHAMGTASHTMSTNVAGRATGGATAPPAGGPQLLQRRTQ